MKDPATEFFQSQVDWSRRAELLLEYNDMLRTSGTLWIGSSATLLIQKLVFGLSFSWWWVALPTFIVSLSNLILKCTVFKDV